MPRKLKTYQTSLGFFDLAVAAPSMKAALAAWRTKANLFREGFAKEANDSEIVAATMAKPGVVLRRAVGSNASFSEHAELPKELPVAEETATRRKPVAKSPAPAARKVEDKAARAAAVAYARDQKRRDRERRRQEAERERRSQAIAKAVTALEEAKRTHDSKIKELAAARSALDRQSDAEETRWGQQRTKLQAALDRARR